MPSPINAPRYHVVKSGDTFTAMCSTDSLNSFPVGMPREIKGDAVSDCVRLAQITSQPAPVGTRVWTQPE